MWFFGMFESALPDPLFSGRLVSVIAGSITFVGIYVIGKRFFTSTTAYLASALYIVIPLFSFYDRQALMESAVAAVGVWSVYYSLLMFLSLERKYAIILGSIFGIGFFIKSSTLLFVFATLCV